VLDSVASIMTAHIVFPTIDPDLPATLSPLILTGLLRQHWGYAGAIVTDAMDMGAITAHWGRGPAAVQSIAAGADILEVFGSLETQVETFEALERAATQGVLTKARIADALERRDQLALTYPARQLEQARAAPDLMVDAWQRGITRTGLRLALLQVFAECQGQACLVRGLALGRLRRGGRHARDLARGRSRRHAAFRKQPLDAAVLGTHRPDPRHSRRRRHPPR